MPKLQPLYDAAPYPLRNVLTSARGYVLTQMRYSPAFWRHLEELLEREKHSPEEMEEYQNDSLRRLISYVFHHVPFYRQLMLERNVRPRDIRSTKDLHRLPILGRETIRARWKEFLSDDESKGGTVRVFTSGTTGAGLPVVYDAPAVARNQAFSERQRIWAGVTPREWRITFLGSRIVPLNRSCPPFWAYNYLEKQILMSIFHLSPAYISHYLAFLATQCGKVLEGFPTVLSIVSHMARAAGASLPMKAVFTNGEPLSMQGREAMESAFAAKVYDSYGMTEWAGLIQECERGRFHVISDYGILEILDQHGQPVPSGQEGYLAWTGFINRRMPFIRYRIGDKGMWDQDQTCPCGRPFPLVSPTVTRDGDNLVLSDGRILSPRAINQVLKNKTSFKVCQLVQHDKETLEIRIVSGNGEAEKEAAIVKKDLDMLLMGQFHTFVQFAREPIQRASGKIPLIISAN